MCSAAMVTVIYLIIFKHKLTVQIRSCTIVELINQKRERRE